MSLTPSTSTSQDDELHTDAVRYSLELPDISDFEEAFRNSGLTNTLTKRMRTVCSSISWPVITTTYVLPSQPTTQAPPPPPTVSTSTKSSGITPFYSDPTDPLPEPFDPTIGELATTVWGDSVEVVGKTVTYDWTVGTDVTEYCVKRKNLKPNELETFYTRSLRRPEGAHTPRHHHTWTKYEGFTQRYQFCTECDEKRGWDD